MLKVLCILKSNETLVQKACCTPGWGIYLYCAWNNSCTKEPGAGSGDPSGACCSSTGGWKRRSVYMTNKDNIMSPAEWKCSSTNKVLQIFVAVSCCLPSEVWYLGERCGWGLRELCPATRGGIPGHHAGSYLWTEWRSLTPRSAGDI